MLTTPFMDRRLIALCNMRLIIIDSDTDIILHVGFYQPGEHSGVISLVSVTWDYWEGPAEWMMNELADLPFPLLNQLYHPWIIDI